MHNKKMKSCNSSPNLTGSIKVFIIIILIIVFISGCSIDTGKNTVDLNQGLPTDIQYDYSEEDRAVDIRLTEYLGGIDLSSNDFIELSNENKDFLIGVAYKAAEDYFEGQQGGDSSLFLETFDNFNREVHALFRIDGKKRSMSVANENNLAKAVYIAAFNASRDETLGGISKNELSNLKIEIFIAGDKKKLDEGYEKGIHGIEVKKGNDIKTYCNNISAEGNYDLEGLLEKMCREMGYYGSCYNDSGTSVYYFPTIHFGTTGYSEKTVSFYRCKTTNMVAQNDIEKIKKSLLSCESWMENNLNDDGYFNYLYYTSNGTYPDSNNMIRQLMSSRWLAEKSNSNDRLLNLHKKNLDYVFKNWYREEDDKGYIFYDNNSKLGAIAMALRTLIYSPYFDDYKDKAEKLANAIISLQNVDGSFSAWYIEPQDISDEDHLLRFYSGEAILSLLEFYIKTNDGKYLDAAKSAQDYYIDEYVKNMNETYYPALVPWQTMSLYHLYMLTKDAKYIDAVFTLSDELIKMQNTDGKPYIDYLGRFYDPIHPEYGVPASSSTAVYIEGLSYAYEIAKITKDAERMFVYKKAIILGAHNLMNLQFIGDDMYYLGHPERVEGAVRSSETSNSIRVDNTQHTIDAFNRIITLFEGQIKEANPES